MEEATTPFLIIEETFRAKGHSGVGLDAIVEVDGNTCAYDPFGHRSGLPREMSPDDPHIHV
ncbi:hypothetical protein ACW9HQ_47045, partial [Nocardia gipuzkoensis]